ncbi:1-aminocyclopropane-1-carboxylate synthase-like protein 1 isoform X3 [Branchiostoma floridae x Branchiostoma japonicum]
MFDMAEVPQPEDSLNPDFISERAKRLCAGEIFLDAAGNRAMSNRYDRSSNSKGIVDFGVSENKLMFDVFEKKLAEPKIQTLAPHMLFYDVMAGNLRFRGALAEFLTERLNAAKPLDPKNVRVCNGAGPMMELVASSIGDPGDCLMMPMPCYGGVFWDVGGRAEINVVPVHLTSKMEEGDTMPFQLTAKKIEDTYNKATAEGKKIVGILLINPHNPLGDIYSAELIMDILNVCHRHSLHVIMDEIYMMSIFDTEAKFTSVLSLPNIPDPQRVHLVWGFAKDFCMSGMRCGVLYSVNEAVNKAVDALIYFNMIPGPIQHVLTEIVLDKEWLDNVFIPTKYSRMREARSYMCDKLSALGIPVRKSPSGLYIWADFRKYIQPLTPENELVLFEKFMDAGVYLTPGIEAFNCGEPGFFRMVFTVYRDHLEVGMERIAAVLKDCAENGLTKPQADNAEAPTSADVKEESLEDLLGLLQGRISSSGWLEETRTQNWATQNPEALEQFKQAMKSQEGFGDK